MDKLPPELQKRRDELEMIRKMKLQIAETAKNLRKIREMLDAEPVKADKDQKNFVFHISPVIAQEFADIGEVTLLNIIVKFLQWSRELLYMVEENQNVLWNKVVRSHCEENYSVIAHIKIALKNAGLSTEDFD